MSTQKIFGLLVTAQKTPIRVKPEKESQCFICGFRFENEDSLIVFADKDFNDRRQVHTKCIENHLKLLSADIKIALVNNDTNEVLSYTTASEKA